MQEIMSSDPKLDPRISAVLEKYHARSKGLENDLLSVMTTLEMEAYFAESCAGEQFLRDQGRAALRRGETATTKFYGTLADTWKQIREKRFPLLVQKIKAKQQS